MSKPVPHDARHVSELLERISRKAANTLARGRLVRPGPSDGALPGGPVRYGRRRADTPRISGGQELLGLHATRLLGRLPAEMRLVALRGEYPRILNHIAALWDEPRELERYFDSLMMDSRGGRRGFPFRVIAEIAELRSYRARIGRRRRAGG
jgi:hypothetical protein